MVVVEFPRAGGGTRIDQSAFTLTCEHGHKTTVSADEVAEELEWNNDPLGLECPECDGCMEEVDAEGVFVECRWCREMQFLEWGDISLDCGYCLGGGFAENARQVVGTSSYFRTLLTDFFERELETAERRGRHDYWELVIHYCSGENFVSILRSGTVRAAPTGYLGRRHGDISRAVCLTETPHLHAEELRTRFGEFGFAFRKDVVLQIGGGPAINIPPALLRRQRDSARRHQTPGSPLVSGWHRSLVPFLNTIQPGQFHFLHEREWRVPHDIELASVLPMLVVPETFAPKLLPGVRSQELVRWFERFGRLRQMAE